MDQKKYSFKDVFSLRIRLCLLAVILIFILGFLFSPKVEVSPIVVEPEDTGIVIIPFSEEPMVRIKEKPVNDLNNVLASNVTENEDPFEEKPVVEPENLFAKGKVADIPFGKPVFIPHDERPKPLNLGELNFKYPKSMQKLRISGRINLQLLIDEKGNVRNVVKMDSLHPILDRVAVENAWKIKFSPAMQRDKPVMVWYGFPVEFRLK